MNVQKVNTAWVWRIIGSNYSTVPMVKIITNRTCRDVINRIAMIVFQFSQNSCRNALLCNFDKNKKGEKRVSASKIWRFWLNRKTYMGVWGQWLRGSAVRAVGGIMLCSIILQKQYIVENNNKNEILKIQFWFSNYSAESSFPALWLSFLLSLSSSLPAPLHLTTQILTYPA